MESKGKFFYEEGAVFFNFDLAFDLSNSFAFQLPHSLLLSLATGTHLLHHIKQLVHISLDGGHICIKVVHNF